MTRLGRTLLILAALALVAAFTLGWLGKRYTRLLQQQPEARPAVTAHAGS